MENLEKLIREATNIVDSNTLVVRTSISKIFLALRIRDLVSKRLCLENPLPITSTNLKFLIGFFNKKIPFSINGIALDLHNGCSVEEVAIKYCEPIEVILEIKNRKLTSDEEIVASKIYFTNELKPIFGRRIASAIHYVDLFKKISRRMGKDNLYWWVGKDLIDNYNTLFASFRNNHEDIKIKNIVIDKKEYITVPTAARLLGVSSLTLWQRALNGLKIFGIIIPFKEIPYSNGKKMRRSLSLKKVEEAKINKKYYIKPGNVVGELGVTGYVIRKGKKIYEERHGKKMDTMTAYIKKENYINFLNIIKELGYCNNE